LDSSSSVIYSIDKRRGRNMMQLSTDNKRLGHVVAYSEGIQALPGSLARCF